MSFFQQRCKVSLWTTITHYTRICPNRLFYTGFPFTSLCPAIKLTLVIYERIYFWCGPGSAKANSCCHETFKVGRI